MSEQPLTPDPAADAHAATLGRFDRSFFVQMVTSFLVFLVAVAAIEVGVRFAMVYYDYRNDGAPETTAAAEQLANDVRTIMINSGGPVAARSVYPILDRNFQAAGLHIAIEPSAATVEAVRENFEFVPRGVRADFPAGSHHEASVDIRADDMCLRCHTTASVGDVLGTVTVRQYLGDRLAAWWSELRTTVAVNVLKIVVHILALFYLLRLLLAPLFTLRSAMGRLAHGAGDLSVRAEVGSSDEFGELAYSLNEFLDRICNILFDIRVLARRAGAVSIRLAQVVGNTTGQLERVQGSMAEVIRVSVADEEEASGVLRALPDLVHETHGLRHMVQEIGFLEEQLEDVSTRSRALLDRVVPETGPSPDVADGEAPAPVGE